MFEHKKSGKLYKLITRNALVQIDDVWLDAVIYQSTHDDSLPLFIREASDFKAKFTLKSTGVTDVYR